MALLAYKYVVDTYRLLHIKVDKVHQIGDTDRTPIKASVVAR